MNLSAVIAANLKRLRQERNLSLGQLSELSSVSKVMLGQIEKADTNPTINTLWKIANGLKVPYTQLIDEHETDTQLVLKDDRIPQEDIEGHYRVFNYYRNTPRRNFELFMIELDPGTKQASIGHSEKAQEYMVVIQGRLRLEAGGKTYDLGPEDSIFFDSSTNHTYINDGDQILKAVLINYYPG